MATDDEMKKALKSFKKRIKMAQLDDDSRLSHGPMSKGGAAKIVSIAPPPGHGREVWEQLVERGYLKRDGVGFYELTGKNWQDSPAAG